MAASEAEAPSPSHVEPTLYASKGGGGDDVLGGAASVPPQLTRGAINGLLCGSDSVDGALGSWMLSQLPLVMLQRHPQPLARG